jgi:hypothetical protein
MRYSHAVSDGLSLPHSDTKYFARSCGIRRGIGCLHVKIVIRCAIVSGNQSEESQWHKDRYPKSVKEKLCGSEEPVGIQ